MEWSIDISQIWQEYGLDELSESIKTLFPKTGISLENLLYQIFSGDILGAVKGVLHSVIGGIGGEFSGVKNVLVWLVVLGIVSALLTYFSEIFEKHQIADLSFYVMYLMLIVVLIQCFDQAAKTAVVAIENIVLFIKLLIPTYLLAVGIATGATTVGAYYQLLLLMIYGVENILAAGLIPVIYSYCMLAIVNGIWIDGKLSALMKLLAKGIGMVLKTAVGIVTGVSIFQAIITPVIDSVKSSVLQKAITSIPGIGNLADGVVELVTGSAVIIKNSLGIIMLILMLVLCAIPLLRIWLIAGVLKIASALIGLVGDTRLTKCIDQVGECCLMLLRTVATAMLLFLITISVLATAANRGF